jgi:hypothetical protein
MKNVPLSDLVLSELRFFIRHYQLSLGLGVSDKINSSVAATLDYHLMEDVAHLTAVGAFKYINQKCSNIPRGTSYVIPWEDLQEEFEDALNYPG